MVPLSPNFFTIFYKSLIGNSLRTQGIVVILLKVGVRSIGWKPLHFLKVDLLKKTGTMGMGGMRLFLLYEKTTSPPNPPFTNPTRGGSIATDSAR